MMAALSLVAGLLALFFGGDLLVKGAASLALSLGVRPLVVGLTVVAFATSAPELAASLMAAWAGSPDIALGNVLGSNIANIALILAITGLIREIPVQTIFLAREVPVLVAISLGLILAMQDDGLARWEGAVLLLTMVVYLGVMIRMEMRADPTEARAVEQEVREQFILRKVAMDVAYVLASVAMLVLGARWLIDGALVVAQVMGLPDRVVGLTLVAVGTSLPELASSVMAAWRGQADIALGNVVGSNILNLVCILGLTVVVHPVAEGAMRFHTDAWVGAALALMLMPMLRRGNRLEKWHGGLLLLAYVVYVVGVLRT